MSERYYAIADIHGEYDKLMKLMENLTINAKLDLSKDYLVQLGDRNDRGPDTYKVNEFFKNLSLQFPNHVICLMGNHDRMLIDTALNRSNLMMFNGGNATLRSYSKATQIYTSNILAFGDMVNKAGHWDWLKNLPMYHETEKYFFSHAPIPKPQYRSIDDDYDFRLDEHTLTWSYGDGLEDSVWIDPNPIPVERDGSFYPGEGKLCLHGHLHGIHIGETGRGRGVIIPGVRRFGNSILLDTGSGCTESGYISCIELPSMKIYNSKGEVLSL